MLFRGTTGVDYTSSAWSAQIYCVGKTESYFNVKACGTYSYRYVPKGYECYTPMTL
jgi:hypothetical protein